MATKKYLERQIDRINEISGGDYHYQLEWMASGGCVQVEAIDAQGRVRIACYPTSPRLASDVLDGMIAALEEFLVLSLSRRLDVVGKGINEDKKP